MRAEEEELKRLEEEARIKAEEEELARIAAEEEALRYFIGQNFDEQNFRLAKLFDGQNYSMDKIYGIRS